MFTARQKNLIVSAVAIRKAALVLLADSARTPDRALPFQKQVEEYDAIIDIILELNDEDRLHGQPAPKSMEPKK